MLYSKQTFLVAGLSRSGVSAAEFLLRRGAKVLIYDDVEEGAVRESTALLKSEGAVPVGKDELSLRTEECDVLVLSPGIPVDHPLPVSFRRAGKRVIGEAELGALALRCPVVAVTGTNGKTTTVSMLDAIFRAEGKRSVACGNVGKPITSCAESLGEDGIAVAEISSFQLETLYSLRPHVAVVLNVTEDHLNRHYNMENYVYLKSRLLKNSAESEYAVLNYDDPVVRGFAEKTKAKTVWFSLRERVDGGYLSDGSLCFRGEKILSESELPLQGAHNTANALAAICAAKLMGTESRVVRGALAQFRGVAHRLQKICVRDGVTFIDDSKATNVDSTIKAIGSVKGETVLLLGGKDKGYAYEPLFDAIKTSSVVHTVLYGENAFRILNAALKKGFTAVTLCRPFETAVRVARMIAREGQNVLLSPASASFDAFRNFEERGDRFAEIVNVGAESSSEETAAAEEAMTEEAIESVVVG
ncbi:MAG: UDP-N-acetylmuramoyl-L-alanine--D-glutamate ligase [Candidatus Gallimonas sp.]